MHWISNTILAVVHAEYPVEIWKIDHNKAHLERRLIDISSQFFVFSLVNKKRVGQHGVFKTTSNFNCLNNISCPTLTTYNNQSQFISVQTGKLSIYNNIENINSEYKLKSDFIPGKISSIAYLPLNRIFLFGSSNGFIKLVS